MNWSLNIAILLFVCSLFPLPFINSMQSLPPHHPLSPPHWFNPLHSFLWIAQELSRRKGVTLSEAQRLHALSLDESIQGVTYPLNWHHLHLFFCITEGELPNSVGVSLYQDVDRIITMLRSKDNFAEYKASLHPSRNVVTIPADMFYSVHGMVGLEYFDEIAGNGDAKESEGGRSQWMYFSCPGLDELRLEVILLMDNSMGILFPSVAHQNLWKMKRIEKTLSEKWESIVENYC
jgi:hypothetical protein